MRRSIGLAAAITLSTVFFCAAWAQAPAVQPHSASIIDVGQMFSDAVAPYINAVISALILAGVTWLGAKIKQKTGIQIDQGHRDALTHALQSEASSLIADGAVKMNGLTVDVKSPELAEAAQALAKRVPDAIAHFGLPPEVLAQKIIDAIPQTAAGAQIVAAAHDQQAGPKS